MLAYRRMESLARTWIAPKELVLEFQQVTVDLHVDSFSIANWLLAAESGLLMGHCGARISRCYSPASPKAQNSMTTATMTTAPFASTSAGMIACRHEMFVD